MDDNNNDSLLIFSGQFKMVWDSLDIQLATHVSNLINYWDERNMGRGRSNEDTNYSYTQDDVLNMIEGLCSHDTSSIEEPDTFNARTNSPLYFRIKQLAIFYGRLTLLNYVKVAYNEQDTRLLTMETSLASNDVYKH